VHTPLRHPALHRIPIGNPDRELVVPWVEPGASTGSTTPEPARPARYRAAMARPTRGPPIEKAELHAQHRRLDLVQPTVESQLLMQIPLPSAVGAEAPQSVGQPLVLRGGEPAIAQRSQILVG